ncbi:MAG: hypothetical protein U5L45_02010 [Saprospiraceae bacterium]|nr:hypothetical protein [Saprospiraceae bacterium]
MVRFSASPKNEPHSLPRASEASARCKNAFRLCPSLIHNYLLRSFYGVFSLKAW